MSEGPPNPTNYDEANKFYGMELTRTFEFYSTRLGLPPSELKDKRVLDIGSGMAGFPRVLISMGITDDVTCINPHEKFVRPVQDRITMLDELYHQKELDPLPPDEIEWLENKISSITVPTESPGLGLEGKEYDVITAIYSVPSYIKDRALLKEVFSEIADLLAEGGTFRCYPYSDSIGVTNNLAPLHEDEEVNEMLDEIMEEKGVTIEVREGLEGRKIMVMDKAQK